MARINSTLFEGQSTFNTWPREMYVFFFSISREGLKSPSLEQNLGVPGKEWAPLGRGRADSRGWAVVEARLILPRALRDANKGDMPSGLPHPHRPCKTVAPVLYAL